jgi:hypothetical protein
MYNHGPSTLQGPVTQARSWWTEDESALMLQSPPAGCDATIMDNHTEDAAPTDQTIRWDLVERVRREIAQGTYETPEKWDVALDRLLDRLEKD